MADPRVYEPTRPSHWDADLGGAPGPVSLDAYHAAISQMAHSIQSLEQEIRKPKRVLPIRGIAAASLDGSGNALIPIYQCAQGFQANFGRLAIWAEGYTPASPFAAAAAYLTIYVSSDTIGTPVHGQMVDFLPTTAGGQLFPAVADYFGTADEAANASPFLGGSEWLMCRVVSGPASKRIAIRYQGVQTAVS